MAKLAQRTIDMLITDLSHDTGQRQQAIHDPKTFVKHHFELTEAQARLVDSISETHWREISEHLSGAAIQEGGEEATVGVAGGDEGVQGAGDDLQEIGGGMGGGDGHTCSPGATVRAGPG